MRDVGAALRQDVDVRLVDDVAVGCDAVGPEQPHLARDGEGAGAVDAARRILLELAPAQMDRDTQAKPVGDPADLAELRLRRADHHVGGEDRGDASVRLAVPALGEAGRLGELRLVGLIVEDELAAHHLVGIGIADHLAHRALEAELLDEGREAFDILLELHDRGAAATQELEIVERADRRALLRAQDRRHRKIETGRRLEAGIFRAAAEDRVADMGVDVDEARRHDLAAPVDDPRDIRMTLLDGGGRADIDDLPALDDDRARLDDPAAGIDGQDRRILDHETHGDPRLLWHGGKGR